MGKKIVVNTRLLLKNKLEGIGWFTYETLSRVTQQHPEHTFFFLFDRPYSDEFIFSDNVVPVVVSPPARHPVLFYIWFELMIPKQLKRLKADLFLSPDGYLSLKTKVPTLVVMHDLNFEHFPKDIPFAARKHYKHFFPKYAKKATRIATVSEYSKQDIVTQYKVNPEKIDVVYNGANELFVPVSEDESGQVRKDHSAGYPYFVFVGALHPRKNLVNLFAGFDLFKEKDQSGIKLLIVGEKMWWTPSIKEAYEKMNHKDDVIFSGRLQMKELTQVVGSALALTYVSYFEGFGIPIVEAFNAETAVITANVTSMPEVAGDAALLIDPFSPGSIAEAMKKISSDENLRNQLILKGREQKKKFTWQKSADRLWASIEKALDQGIE
ncbi:MAG: glycosyltransferase family 1 protein [Bacteroidales bacterium]